MPTLLVGDLILVNKFHYGVRLPVINKKIIANHDPQRGDVMVFRYPQDPSIDYIKRVVGVPGDEVVVPQPAAHHQRPGGAVEPAAAGLLRRGHARVTCPKFKEKLGGVEHRSSSILNPTPFFGSPRQPVPVPRELPLQCRGRDLQGAAGPLLHDGRQPRQLAGLALLGLRAGREHRRQGVLRLDEFRRPEAHRVVPARPLTPAQERRADDRSRRAARAVSAASRCSACCSGPSSSASWADRHARAADAQRVLHDPSARSTRSPPRARPCPRSGGVREGRRTSSTRSRRSRGKDLDITKENDKVVIRFAYDKEVELDDARCTCSSNTRAARTS